MSQVRNRVLSWGMICVLFSLLLQFSCVMSVATLKGEPGKDISSVKPGSSKHEAEEILGSPIREWTTPLNIRYCVYSYDAGIPPNMGEAAFYAIAGIISVGLFDLYEATGLTNMGETREAHRVIEKIAISYDANNIIVGVFDHFGDFDILPDDGHSEKCQK